MKGHDLLNKEQFTDKELDIGEKLFQKTEWPPIDASLRSLPHSFEVG